MNLKDYLERIDVLHPVKPDHATLCRLVKAQLRAVPFENLDQQMGVDVSTDIERVYEKIVLRQRGGWCFELNGLFGWLLTELGFEVSMHAGFVGPEKPRPGDVGDHMFLLVNCDGLFLVDVGFGGGPFQPIPLRASQVRQPPYTILVSDEDGEWYKYSEFTEGNGSDYWFTLDKVDTSYFLPANHRLQTDPSSPFKRTLTAQRRLENRHVVLRGLVKKTFDEFGAKEERLSGETALVDCLLNDFNLDVPQISACWPLLRKRHEELFGS